MRDALRGTGRPIVLSICEWGTSRPWTWGAGTGHMWRTTHDLPAHGPRDRWRAVCAWPRTTPGWPPRRAGRLERPGHPPGRPARAQRDRGPDDVLPVGDDGRAASGRQRPAPDGRPHPRDADQPRGDRGRPGPGGPPGRAGVVQARTRRVGARLANGDRAVLFVNRTGAHAALSRQRPRDVRRIAADGASASGDSGHLRSHTTPALARRPRAAPRRGLFRIRRWCARARAAAGGSKARRDAVRGGRHPGQRDHEPDDAHEHEDQPDRLDVHFLGFHVTA